MSCKRVFITICVFFVLCNISIAYYVEDDGKCIVVKNKNVINLIDTLEMKEGEALTPDQILTIVKNNGKINQDY